MSDIPGVLRFLWCVWAFKRWLSWHERSNIENHFVCQLSFFERVKNVKLNEKMISTCIDRRASGGKWNVGIWLGIGLKWWRRRQWIIGNKSGQISGEYKEEEEEEDAAFLVGWGPSCCLASHVTLSLFAVLSWFEVNDLVENGITVYIWIITSGSFVDKAQKGFFGYQLRRKGCILFEKRRHRKNNKSIVNAWLSRKSWLVATKDGSIVTRTGLRSLSNGDKDAASDSNWTSSLNSSLSCCILSDEFFIMVIGGKNTSSNSLIENKWVVADDLFGFFSDLGNGTYNFFERGWPRV